MNKQLIKRKTTLKGLLAGAVMVLSLGTVAMGSPLIGLSNLTASHGADQVEIVNFVVNPISQTIPEIVLRNFGSGPDRILLAAPTAIGSQGNGDGVRTVNNTPPAPTYGGFQIDTPMQFTSLNGYTVDHYGGVADGVQTSFFDVSLELSNLVTDGPAESFGSRNPKTVVQYFTQGTFTLLTTYRDDTITNDRQVLLTGTITNLELSGQAGSQVASMLSSEVEYTGGAILDAWKATGGSTQGSLTWSVGLISPYRVDYTGTNSNMRFVQFDANLGGQLLAVVPEPASFALLAVASVGLLGRRFRKQKNASK